MTEADEQTFKVTDRRGRVREEIETPPPAESRTPTGRETPSAAPAPGAPDLQGIFVMLASSALISLGEVVDPAAGEPHTDLDQARVAIDMLRVLRDKTSGNRTDQEDQVLEELLYDLQMRFIRAVDTRGSR
jgi:hypothetical protein